MYRHLTIQICPPMLETREVPIGETWHLRPVPLPIGPRQRTPRPLVYVSFGTLFNRNLDLFQTALEGLADGPLDVVMTADAKPASNLTLAPLALCP